MLRNNFSKFSPNWLQRFPTQGSNSQNRKLLQGRKTNADNDIFEEVPDNEIAKVLKCLKINWPKHFLFHQYLTNMMKYKERKLNTTQVLYRYGNIGDGAYLLKNPFLIGQTLHSTFFIYSPSEDLKQMSNALAETSRIPWRKEFLFENTFSQFTPLIEQVASSKGCQLTIENNQMVWLPPEKDINMSELPGDVCLKFLDDSHVPELDRNWPHNFPGSHKFLSQEIKLNFGLGIFRKSDDKMLSSALSFHSGGLFVLHTDEQCRGSGYAEMVMRHMIRETRLRGNIPFGAILVENTASLKLTKKLGFEEFAITHFITPAGQLLFSAEPVH